jgi:hypothetical protein
MYGSKDRRLIFGIDFDDTITKDLGLFVTLIDVMKQYGADVYIVTARQENGWCPTLREFSEKVDVKVIFSGAKAKHDVAEIDIWIDDFPLAITHDFKEYGWRPSKSTEKDIV